MGARERLFLAVLGWVLLGIVRSVNLYLDFGDLINKLTKSECSRGCGHDGGDSLLTVTTG